MSQVTLVQPTIGSVGWGAGVNDNFAQIQAALRPPHCRVNQSNSQNIPSGVFTVIDWNNVDYDPLGMFSPSNDRIIVPDAGVYLFSMAIFFDNMAVGGFMVLNFRKLIAGVMTQICATVPPSPNAAGNVGMNFCLPYVCAAGDQFDVQGYQTTGVGKILAANGNLNYFSATRLLVL